MIFKKNRLTSKLKHQLILQQRTNTPDSMGGYTQSWSDVATLWAEIMPISGNERFAYSQLSGGQRYRIVLRYRSDITPSMRLKDSSDGRVFDIKSVINKHEASQVVEILADVAIPNS